MNAVRFLVLVGIASLALPGAAAADRGEQLYALCAQCHGGDGGGDPAALAPDIAGLPQWFVEGQLRKFRAGGRGTHFDDIGGMRMRPMSLWIPSDEDVTAVAAHVASLPVIEPEPTLEDGDAARGKTLYGPCQVCHGPSGSGNKLLNAPPLNHASDWYLLTSLKNFKQGVRGTDPRDLTGAQMRPMALALPDEQAMRDVIAYIMSLPPDAGGAAQ